MSNGSAGAFDPRTTLIDVLRRRAADDPNRRAFTFLLDGETEQAHLTFADLDRQARAVSVLLREHARPGDRALLLYPPGLEYIAAFMGCLYAGVVAVPAYPPNPARLERSLPRLEAIVSNARPTVALTVAPILSIATALAAQNPVFQPMRWLATDGLSDQLAEQWHPTDIRDTGLAFLQYTSGSTSTPKGVMLTHRNLMHNSALIQRGFGHTRESQGVIWLPPYHDMGLIGGILQPLYAGFPVVLLSPVDFLQRPLRWLQAVSRYGATTSGGPNFAYDLCVRKTTPEQRAALDLGSWEVAFNGAEPLRPETLDRFVAAFEVSGFRREAFYPCYGLAEATLIVSGAQLAAPPVICQVQAAALERNVAALASEGVGANRAMVSSGQICGDQQVVIVDGASGTRCSPGQIGEIWVSGPSIAQGYWDQHEDTAHAFGASLAEHSGERYLRTGDLGFQHGGELFVTGRLKDVIIIRGRNHYPQDIERTVEVCHPALRLGGGAAFALEVAGEEQLIVVQEIERQHRTVNVEELCGQIRHAVGREHGVQVAVIALLKPGSIPKTSSGKIQRYACRQAFLAGDLALIGQSALEHLPAEAPPEPQSRNREGTRRNANKEVNLRVASRSFADRSQLAADLTEEIARALRVPVEQLAPDQSLIALGLELADGDRAERADRGAVGGRGAAAHPPGGMQYRRSIGDAGATAYRGRRAAHDRATPAPRRAA